MANLVRKVHCPGGTHEDKTPSCAIYDDNSMYCFACNKYFKGDSVSYIQVEKEKEDLNAKFIYINSLPSMEHRNLSFHFDSRGYYITWSLQDFYKMRLWAPRPGEPKYIGAKGHKKPWFVLRAYQKVSNCIIVEGEINALSIDKAIGRDQFDILSPGGASNFHDSEMKLRSSVFKNYDKILVLVDADKAGTEAAIKLHGLIKPHCLNVKIKLMEKGSDCNEILVKYGKEKLKEIILGM